MENYPLSDIKEDVKHVEPSDDTANYPCLSQEEIEFFKDFEARGLGKKVARKIDVRLIPVLTILYLLAHVDRGNLGNAKIEGMETDLRLVNNQYNVASTLFFTFYIVFQVPSNMVLKKVRPSRWLPTLVILWGVVMTCMGTVKNFHGLIACRLMLGLCESGFFPAAVYLITTWYPRHEVQQRVAIMYTASAFSGALGGLLAFAISNMHGIGGYAGWAWIFLLEGAVTVAVGLALPFLIVDSPERATRWLSDDERRFIDCRLRVSGAQSATGETADRFSWTLLAQTLADPKIWMGIFLGWANSVPNTAFQLTMPQIIKQLGFVNSQAQLLTIPPYFCGGLSAWLTGRFADRFTWRMPFLVGPLCILITALSMLFGLSKNIQAHVPALYFAIVLAQIGIFPLNPGISSWTSNNLAPSWKRSIGIAWLLAAGNFGSLIGGSVFLNKEAPYYPTGYGTALGVCVFGLVCAFALEVGLMWANKRKKAMSETEIREKYTQLELDKMGDKSPMFHYIL